MARRRRTTGPLPIEQRQHFRQVMRVKAQDVKAGDALVVKKGTIRSYYHICEVGIDDLAVEVVYNAKHEPGGHGRKGFIFNERVTVRRTTHD